VWDFCGEREEGLGVVDIKSFYLEPATDIADHIRETLHYIAPEKVYINPDGSFFPLPRWLAVRKLQRMVEGTKIVCHELAG